MDKNISVVVMRSNEYECCIPKGSMNLDDLAASVRPYFKQLIRTEKMIPYDEIRYFGIFTLPIPPDARKTFVKMAAEHPVYCQCGRVCMDIAREVDPGFFCPLCEKFYPLFSPEVGEWTEMKGSGFVQIDGRVPVYFTQEDEEHGFINYLHLIVGFMEDGNGNKYQVGYFNSETLFGQRCYSGQMGRKIDLTAQQERESGNFSRIKMPSAEAVRRFLRGQGATGVQEHWTRVKVSGPEEYTRKVV